MKRSIRAVTTLLAVLCVVAGTTSGAVSQAAPYEINVILSLTGADAFIGNEEASAVRIAEDVVNKSGGIRGRPVRFVIADDASVPGNSVQLLSTLMQRPIPLVLGSTVAALCNAMSPLVEHSGPVEYCFSPILQPANGSYVFAIAMTTRDIVSAMAQYARARGWTRLGMITSTDATGLAMERTFNDEAAAPNARPIAFTNREHFADTDLSVAAQVARIKAEQPQAILGFSAGTSFGTLMRGLHDAGVDLPVIASAANMARTQLTQYNAFLPKDLLFFSAGGVAPDPSAPPKVRDAQRVYFDAFRRAGQRPGIFSADIWDPAMLVVDALRTLGTDVGAQQLRDYIEQLSGWAGVSGTYDFRRYPHRGLGQSSTVAYRWDRDKQDIFVIPR